MSTGKSSMHYFGYILFTIRSGLFGECNFIRYSKSQDTDLHVSIMTNNASISE